MRLTREEIILVCGVLAALLVGVAVKQLRTQARLEATQPAAAVRK
jgi:hypothetical protein